MDLFSNIAVTPNLLLTIWLALPQMAGLDIERPGLVMRPARAIKKADARTPKVNLNSATRAQLLQLPGIDQAAAEQIVRNRPYQTIDELDRAGLAPKAVERIRPMVDVAPRSRMLADLLGGGTSQRIDLNSASLAQLQNLPGVGPALGARLMAGRPFRTMEDVARIGIPLNVVEQIRPLVVLGP